MSDAIKLHIDKRGVLFFKYHKKFIAVEARFIQYILQIVAIIFLGRKNKKINEVALIVINSQVIAVIKRYLGSPLL